MVLGPPGCGKTTRLIQLVLAELARGVSPERIAFLTFTRAACNVATARLAVAGDKCPEQVCTIHAACYRLLEPGADRILDDAHWQGFAARHGYRLSLTDPPADPLNEALAPPPHRTPDDQMRFVYEWARARLLDPLKALARCPRTRVPARAYSRFVERLQDFKASLGLYDFSDLLEEVLEVRAHLDADVVFVDEAQDLSPLQIAVVEMWFETAERVYVAGDDDQAIYSFHGADPGWLLRLASETEPEILRQSYRVPVRPQKLAERIISRNRERVPKDYRPAPRFGSIRRLGWDAALRLADGTVDTFVLVRNRMSIRAIARRLVLQGVPLVVEGPGGTSPLSNAQLCGAVRAAIWLGGDDDARISAVEFESLVSFIPSGKPLMPRGAKKAIRQAVAEKRQLSRREIRDEFELGLLIGEVRLHGPLSVLRKLPASIRAYLQRILDRFGVLPDPNVIVTTIHGSKGRESSRVIIVSDMSRATWEGYLGGSGPERESENRVFFVGVTRTKDELILVEPRSRRHFAFPSVSFEEGEA